MHASLIFLCCDICVHVFEFVLGLKHYQTRTALTKNALIHNERVLNSEDWYSQRVNRSGQADFQRKCCCRQWIPEFTLGSCLVNHAVCCPGSSLCSSLVWLCQYRVGGQTVWMGPCLCMCGMKQEHEACQGSTEQDIMMYLQTSFISSLCK